MWRNKISLLLVILPASVLLLGIWGCKEGDSGNSGYNAQVITKNVLEYNQAVGTLKEIDEAVNNRDLEKAIDYFSDNAIVEVKDPLTLKVETLI